MFAELGQGLVERTDERDEWRLDGFLVATFVGVEPVARVVGLQLGEKTEDVVWNCWHEERC